MLSAIEISRNTKLDSVGTLASKLGINPDEIVPYGRYIAKVPLTYMNDDKIKKSNLILVTAITPTAAGTGLGGTEDVKRFETRVVRWFVSGLRVMAG